MDGASLLTAKQERHLAGLVQQLLRLERTRKTLGQALGRAPQLEEWAAEAGKQHCRSQFETAKFYSATSGPVSLECHQAGRRVCALISPVWASCA